MSRAMSPFEQDPPTTRRLLLGIGGALIAAALVLLLVVLPAEYNLDLTGFGKLSGLTALSRPTRTLQVRDVVGGNEKWHEIKVPDSRDPVPLPNPAVAQIKPAAARTENITVKLKPGQQTEIKAILDASQVIVYSWRAEGGAVYTDFHGHEPDAGDAFVRYEEQKSGSEGHGSLVAPFAGEHGWYWLNISDQPVTITLQFTGYHKDVKDYGLSEG